MCVFMRGWMEYTHTNTCTATCATLQTRIPTHTHEQLTVMYLTSISVFFSSSVTISLWNLLNFRSCWGTGQKRGREHTAMIRNLSGGWSATLCHKDDSTRIKWRNEEWWSFGVDWYVCAGVTAKSKVELMNESETKRGNSNRHLSLSPVRSLWFAPAFSH